MDIIMYQFSKRENSTKRPTTGQSVTAVLKNDCSRMNPVFELSKTYASYNYIKFEEKYYWIDNITYISNDIIRVDCHMDVLASYKNLIGLSTQYILRSASSYDTNIIDSYYPTKAGAALDYGTISNVPWTYSNGYYMVGVLQFQESVLGAQKRGGVTYFLCTSDQIKDMIATMSTTEALTNNINPLDYISTCVYIPFNITVGALKTVTWDIAGQTVALSYYEWVVPYHTDSFQINLPIHPYYATRGKYVGYAPFTKYTFYCGPFGTIDIPTELLGDIKIIFCNLLLDIISGDAILTFYNNNIQSLSTPVIAKVKARLSVPIQLSQLSSGITYESKMRLVSSAMQIGASLVNPIGYITGANVGNVASAGLSAISTSIDMVTPRLHTNGSNGSFADLRDTVELVGEFLIPVDEDIEDRGRPLCQTKQINTLSGFILCADADIQGVATAEELNAIRSYMNTGFFYE